jgi:hypothetical protein
MFKLLPDLYEKMLAHGLLAFVGGVASYISSENSPKILKMFFHGVVGSFAGVLFGLFSSCFIQSDYFQMAAAGLGGWFGRDGIDWLFLMFKKIISKRIK